MGDGTETPPVPRLLALATAVPSHVLDQAEVVEQARCLFAGWDAAGLERMLPVFANAGIETRYSCAAPEWLARPHGWAEKNRLYLENALELIARAAGDCLERAGVAARQVDAVVCVSTTGIATPSLDARLAGRLGLGPRVQRLPVFGLGCAGGVLGLARAAALARAAPRSRVLFVVVETCVLTFRRADQSKSNLVATALFGDGAAAALVSCAGAGDGDGDAAHPALAAWGEHTWPDSLDVMGWRVEDDGLGVLFSRSIPDIIRRDFAAALDGFLAAEGMDVGGIGHFLCHPGGAKVVDALEDALGLPAGGLAHSRAVLRDYGNMSAATVVFVLERALAAGARGRCLLSAVGPGFSAGFLVVDVP